MLTCPSCGAQNEERARFCLECGTKLAADAGAASESRRTVTVLFSDVVGSTALGEALDPETLRSVMNRYFAAMQAVIERHGGRVEKFVGDAIMAIFGLPRVHEDDALRAARAAVEMRDALAAFNASIADMGITIQTRTGLNTGEVVAGSGSAPTLITGDTVNTAARLEQAAGVGEILVGDTTARLIRQAADLAAVPSIVAKGKAEAVAALRLDAVGRSAGRTVSDAPLVAREAELALLHASFAQAASSNKCHVVTVVGAPGLGKSRLVAEFVGELELSGQTRVLGGRCLSYGEGLTYWPLREIVLGAAGVGAGASRSQAAQAVAGLLASESDGSAIADRLLTALGLTEGAVEADEINWAVRRTAEALMAGGPVVFLIEDVHWARPPMLELISYLHDTVVGPLLIVCPARPEILARRTGWAQPRQRGTMLLLDGLPADAGERLIDATAGPVVIDGQVRQRILETAEGNPLFVEELVRLIVESGQQSIAIPPTIEALMAARIDQLPAAEAGIAQRGAVVGRVFERPALAALVSGAQRATLDEQLRELLSKELIRREGDVAGGDPTYKFRHILIRDAAYNALAKVDRAKLHEAFANWLESASAGRDSEYEEIIGYHLEQAYGYRVELRESGAAIDRLGQRAAALLTAAGETTFFRGDIQTADRLFQRAAALPFHDAGARASAYVIWGRVLSVAGEFDRAVSVVNEALEVANDAGLVGTAARARLQRADALASAGRIDFAGAAYLREVDAALADARRSGDSRALSDGWEARSRYSYYSGDLAQSIAETQLAIDSATAAGDARYLGDLEISIAMQALVGDVPNSEVVRIAKRLLERGERYPAIRIEALRRLSAAEAMLGQPDDAFDHIEQSLQAAGALRRQHDVVLLLADRAWIERLAGLPEDAVESLRASIELAQSAGELDDVPWSASRLAVALVALGRFDEAEVVIAGSGPYTALANRARVLGCQARIKGSRGDRSARADVEDLVALVGDIGFIHVKTDALIDAAETMRALDDHEAALRYWREALRLCERKENFALADQLRRRMAEV